MNYNPLVSVVIPTFNRSKVLPRAISSVLNQTYSNLECIIIDNNSTDKTNSILEKITDKRLKVYKIDNCGIVAKSRNLGISVSKGEYIAFLDSDDWWRSKKIEYSVKELKKGFDITYHHLLIKSEKKSFTIFSRKIIKAKSTGESTFNYLVNKGNPIPLSSVVLKKNVINSVCGFNENLELVGGEDFFTWILLAKKNYRFKLISKVLGFYYVSSDALTSSSKCKRYFKKIFNLLNQKEFKNGDNLPNWCYWSIAYSLFKEKKFEDSKKYLLISLNSFNNKLCFFKSCILIVFIFIIQIKNIWIKNKNE